MVALDERGGPRRESPGRDPRGEVAGPVVLPRRLVDAVGIRPDAEVTHVEHVGEAHAEGSLEREHVVVHAVESAMDVAGSAEDHAPT